MTWNWAALLAAVMAGAGALYIRLRWRRAPQAYAAIIAVAACYFMAGAVLGAWVLRFWIPSGAANPAAQIAAAKTAPASAPNEATSATASNPETVPSAAPAIAGPSGNPGNRFTATVTEILDGDTVDVTGPGGPARIRLEGIDAPEHGQAYGTESTQQLAA